MSTNRKRPEFPEFLEFSSQTKPLVTTNLSDFNTYNSHLTTLTTYLPPTMVTPNLDLDNYHSENGTQPGSRSLPGISNQIQSQQDQEKFAAKNKKDKKRAYLKQYRENNKDIRKAYLKENEEKIRKVNKQYRDNNKDKIKQWKKDYCGAKIYYKYIGKDFILNNKMILKENADYNFYTIGKQKQLAIDEGMSEKEAKILFSIKRRNTKDQKFLNAQQLEYLRSTSQTADHINTSEPNTDLQQGQELPQPTSNFHSNKVYPTKYKYIGEDLILNNKIILIEDASYKADNIRKKKQTALTQGMSQEKADKLFSLNYVGKPLPDQKFLSAEQLEYLRSTSQTAGHKNSSEPNRDVMLTPWTPFPPPDQTVIQTDEFDFHPQLETPNAPENSSHGQHSVDQYLYTPSFIANPEYNQELSQPTSNFHFNQSHASVATTPGTLFSYAPASDPSQDWLNDKEFDPSVFDSTHF